MCWSRIIEAEQQGRRQVSSSKSPPQIKTEKGPSVIVVTMPVTQQVPQRK